MKTYDYTLTFSILASDKSIEQCTDLLFEAGCDDALVGIGAKGSIALNFNRLAESAEQAIQSSIAQVTIAIAGAQLLEVKPDMVGLSDIANLVGCSRQNIRKLATDSKTPFPQPSVSGTVPLWHFFEVGSWLMENSRVKSKPSVEAIEVSKLAFKLNLEAQKNRFEQCIAEPKPTY